MTLALRQAVEQRLGKRIVTTGGSFPDQLLANPLPPGNDSFHILFYAPWFPERAPHPPMCAALAGPGGLRPLPLLARAPGRRTSRRRTRS